MDLGLGHSCLELRGISPSHEGGSCDGLYKYCFGCFSQEVLSEELSLRGLVSKRFPLRSVPFL